MSANVKNITENRCEVCKVMFESKEDTQLRKKYKHRNTCIGCEVKECKYWVHVRCTKLKIRTANDINKLMFFFRNIFAIQRKMNVMKLMDILKIAFFIFQS